MCGCKKKNDAQRLSENYNKCGYSSSARSKANEYYKNYVLPTLERASNSCSRQVYFYPGESAINKFGYELSQIIRENGFSVKYNKCLGELEVSF